MSRVPDFEHVLSIEDTPPAHWASLQPHYRFLGRVDRFSAVSSKLRRCPLHAEVSPFASVEFAPAHLGRESAHLSVQKYQREHPTLDLFVLSRAEELFRSIMDVFMIGSQIGTWSDVLMNMELSTSCGYPWSTTFYSKSDMIEELGEEKVINLFDQRWSDMGSDTSVPGLWSCTLKDELRPKIKVKEKKTRTFTGAPVDFVAVGNRLFLDQNKRFIETHLQHFSAVGYSPLKGGAQRLYEVLASVSEQVLCTDVSAWDACCPAAFWTIIARMRYEWLDKSSWSQQDMHTNWNRVINFYSEVVFTPIVLPDGYVFVKSTGNPSGQPNTTYDNTMIHMLLFLYCLVQYKPDISAEFVKANFVPLFYGDDSIISYSPRVEGFISEYPSLATRIGFVTREEYKGPLIRAGKTWSERGALFLGFRLISHHEFGESRIIAQYNPKRVFAILYWTKNPGDVAVALNRVNAALILGFADPSLRQEIRLFEKKIWKEAQYLEGTEHWPEILAAYHAVKTDYEIWLLLSEDVESEYDLSFQSINNLGLTLKPAAPSLMENNGRFSVISRKPLSGSARPGPPASPSTEGQ